MILEERLLKFGTKCSEQWSIKYSDCRLWGLFPFSTPTFTSLSEYSLFTTEYLEVHLEALGQVSSDVGGILNYVMVEANKLWRVGWRWSTSSCVNRVLLEQSHAHPKAASALQWWSWVAPKRRYTPGVKDALVLLPGFSLRAMGMSSVSPFLWVTSWLLALDVSQVRASCGPETVSATNLSQVQ